MGNRGTVADERKAYWLAGRAGLRGIRGDPYGDGRGFLPDVGAHSPLPGKIFGFQSPDLEWS